MPRPTFLYIGADKSGSTWLYHALDIHPQVYVPEIKDLYFFDRYFERGVDWYVSKFASASSNHKAIGELSHDYLYSEDACNRIRATFPEIKLIVFLRNPVDRAFSHWLYRRRLGLTDASFEQELESYSTLLEKSRYGRHLRRYLERFDREQLYIGFFSRLQKDPVSFANEIYSFLGVSSLSHASDILSQRRLPAAKARNQAVARLVHRAAQWARTARLERAVGLIKKNDIVQRVLYRRYGPNERPSMRPETRARLMEKFERDIAELEHLLGRDLPELRN